VTIDRVLTLAAIFVAATIVLYISGGHWQPGQTRVFLLTLPNEPEAQVAQKTQYLRQACPDMIVIKDQDRADYIIVPIWRDKTWAVEVERRDVPWLFYKHDSPDAIETFRQSCAAIRADARELADFDAHAAPMPIGRYLMYSATPSRVFLLDTKTGAVWESKPDWRGTQQFERVAVEGLHDRNPFGLP
jgi:hypothetical protein